MSRPGYLGLLLPDDVARYFGLAPRDATPPANASTLALTHQLRLGVDCCAVRPYHQPGNALWDERGFRWFLPAPELGRPVGGVRAYDYDAVQAWLRNCRLLERAQLVVLPDSFTG